MMQMGAQKQAGSWQTDHQKRHLLVLQKEIPADAVDVNAGSVITGLSCGTGQWGVRRRQDGDSKAHHAVPGMDREWRLHQ